MMSTRALANAVRFLSIDAVEKAKSGHPGMPLGMADIATVLWQQFLRHHPENPSWFNRDRFILSNGHGSMLLYSLLHLTGYALSLDELKHFRQLHSKTPGHPEYGHTPGVETTTGPLGQGLANAVGMAIAEKHLAARFNRPGHTLVDHDTYVFVGDGCLMEGISHEVCSLAGTLQLEKLMVFYDDNGISIDGPVSSWFTDNTAMRFQAYGWHVVGPFDGHSPQAIEHAIIEAKADPRPSLLICKTIIGFGSPKEGQESVHGSPLGAENIQKTRDFFGWDAAPFEISAELYAGWNHQKQGAEQEQVWLEVCSRYQQAFPDDYRAFLRQINGDLPDDWDQLAQDFLLTCQKEKKPLATRQSSQRCIEYWSQALPELLGGSADLTGSNLTNWSGTMPISAHDFSGNYIFYGVREFGMSAVMNGLALHGGVIPLGGTFLVFADYARNAMRLSALMGARVIYVLTHDSIGLGEDGPTHQPIEHAAMLRMTPNMHVWRPADLVETAVAWESALLRHQGPTCLLLSRQALPAVAGHQFEFELIKKGGYILADTAKVPDAIFIATGSEVSLALQAAEEAKKQLGLQVRVVSMPCCERFLEQDAAYQEQVLPSKVRNRLAIEAGCKGYWYRFVGLDGAVIGIDAFGVSAPGPDAFAYFGFTVETLLDWLKQSVAPRHPERSEGSSELHEILR
ncbi:MAG: transketolase [Gammaproteobacteria bacterium]|nr:transketolase [Gammaproteobacteria bacterium]